MQIGAFSVHQIERAHDVEWQLAWSAYGNVLVSSEPALSELHYRRFGMQGFLSEEVECTNKWTFNQETSLVLLS